MAVVAVGIAGAAGGAVVLHAMSGPAKISLSSNASRDHKNGMGSMGNGMNSMGGWSFSTIDNQSDPTFNQLLGINNRGEISGYFGSGAQGHANKGYQLVLSRRGSFYESENFPGAMQTQVTGLNDTGITVGFWSGQDTANMMNDNFGFYALRGRYHTVNWPTMNNASPAVNQLLGVNDRGVAVGFYTNGQGANRGYLYDIFSHRFHRVMIPGVRNLSSKVSLTATAINNNNDVAGFYSVSGGTTYSFLKTDRGHFTRLAFPGAASTQAFGVNDWREVAGTYTMGSGSSAKTYGFTWTSRMGFKTISDPQGVGTTTLNGINDAGDLVGFYTDAAGNTDGLLYAASRHMTPTGPMPTMSATPSMTPSMSMSASPSMSPSMSPTGMPTAKPTPTTTTTTAPNPSASPSGGAW
jgi:hypothetical protein